MLPASSSSFHYNLTHLPRSCDFYEQIFYATMYIALAIYMSRGETLCMVVFHSQRHKAMQTVNLLKWALLTFFPIASTVPIPPFAPRPLCNFQLALANQACAYLPSSSFIPPPPQLPFAPVFPPPPPPPEHHDQVHGHKHDLSHDAEPGHDNAQNQSQSHEHKHVPEHGHGHHMHGHHDRVHGHHHKHKLSPVEQQCCKWLAQVDDECVCELLGRLPPFLVRPLHEYTVRVAGSCNTTYSCGAQFRL